MMESCFNYKTERVESVVVEDLKKDLFADFSAITSTVPQDSTPLEKEHLQVYLRIRPFTSTEIDNGESQECVALEPPDIVLLKAPRMSMSARLSDKSVTQTVQRFQFSQVYGPETTQKDMFDGTVRCLVKDVLEGGNSLVFTYGVTNAGKTFTFLGPDSDGGILPRSLNVIFNSIEDRIYTQMNVKPHRCREFTRLTKDQQDEEATNKRNIMRLFKESDSQKSTASQLSSTLRGTLLEGSTMSDAGELVDADSFSLNVGCHTKFSVWVSFCEIYNENIHDLLEPISTGSLRRTVLRLSQDVKGNSFVKDLKWIQVNDADEAYKVLKLGKKNQSFSCTKLSSLSSRSHSVFSIRILRIEDVGIPRVHMVSELSLCDLAGSERCAKTHNKGDRLKEAGNINTSLLILGKCINALRHNQQSKLQQHVPFRESKLTHYLQGFFCGRGKACMIVNINQCASMYDETLNVLKFSAVAQKVVVLNTKPLPVIPKRSGREVSLIINNADQKNFWAKRKSSLVGWDTTLEDVQEKDDDDEDGDFEEETCDESAMEVTIQEADEGDEETDKESYENLLLLVVELKKKLHSEESDKLTLESRVREEVTKEFMELFSKMESDYSERLLKEKEIIEERAERRLEILRNLVSQNADVDEGLSNSITQSKEKVFLDGMMDAIQDDLAGIKKVAEAAQTCLVASSDPHNPVANFEKQLSELTEDRHKAQQLLDQKTSEVETMHVQMQQTNDQLKEANKNLESQAQKFQELMDICQEKDEMISKLQTAMDHQVETTTNDRNFIETVKEEILELKKNCKCLNKDGESMPKECRKRLGDVERDLDGQPPLKKGSLNEDHVMTVDGTQQLQADCKQKELEIMQMREKYAGLQQQLESIRVDFQSELKLKDQQMGQLKQEHLSLQNEVYKLNDRLKQQACACEAAQSSLEVERQEKIKLVKENDTMANEICELRRSSEETASKITALDCELSALRERSEKVSADLRTAKVLLVEHNNSSRQKSKTIESLTQEAQQLREEMETSRASLLQGNCGQFRDTMGALHQECEKVVKDSAQKTRQIQDLNQEVCQLRRQLAEQEELSGQLKQELVNFQEKAQTDLMRFEAERRTAAETAKGQSELEAEAAKLKGTVAHLQEQLQTSAASVTRVAELEKKLAEKEAQVAALKEMQDKLADARAPSPPSLVEARHKEAERRRELLKVAEEAIAQKDAELERKEQQLSKLRKEVISGSDKVKSLSLDLQRKEDDTADLKEKLADSKRQIQQVEKEVASMREEEKSLRRKLNDSEKMKAQLLSSLSSKDQAIHQLKSGQASSAKSDENLQLYQKACDDITAKEQVIENMRLALSEQEETQQEQDLVLEAKLDEIESLNQELRKLKERFLKQNSDDHKDSRILRDCHSDECKQAIQNTNAAVDRLKLVNEKHQSDKKKWLEEKLILISQAKEAEERRNQEMRRFADDRERFAKVQIEAESLSKQLSEKNEDLLKWRKERDALVAALEIQMQRLKASNAEKDQKLKELQQNRNSRPLENINKEEELQQRVYEKDAEIMLLKEQLKVFSDNAKETHPVSQKNSRLRNLNGSAEKIDVPFKKPLEDSELKGGISSSRSSEENEVLDSSEISTENGRGSRFPKPQLEIQFTSLQPNKLNVKRQDGDSSVTVKITRSAKKRKSHEMEKDPVESENRKNSRYRPSRMLAERDESPATPSKKIDQMKSQESQPTLRNRRDVTLQKIGDFFQSSPNLLGSKAKKIIGLMSPKSPEPEGGTSLSFKPKKPKRKLYKTEISSPLDIPSHPIICHDQDDKESDHLIIKRRLRSRTAKK